MNYLSVQAGNKWSVAEVAAHPSIEALKRDLLCGNNVCEDFVLLGTPAPAFDRTICKVYRSGDELLVLASVYDVIGTNPTSLEIFFDCRHDHTGFLQYCFSAEGDPETYHYSPYAESYSTAFQYPRCLGYQWERDHAFRPLNGSANALQWLCARFAVDEIFATGSVCGFNIARSHPSIREASSWSHASSKGFRDALSFGHLYLDELPAVVTIQSATLNGNRLEVTGTVSSQEAPLTLEVVDPLGNSTLMPLQSLDGNWHGTVELPHLVHGRYLLYPRSIHGRTEPEYFTIDIPVSTPGRTFPLSMTYDIGVDMRANYFTPDRLAHEMKLLTDWGFTRAYWIGNAPSRNTQRSVAASENGRLTSEHCGDLLPLAAKTAKAAGLELLTIFKLFDLGINDGNAVTTSFTPEEAVERGLVKDIEGWYYRVLPEIAEHQDWTMQAHSAWQTSRTAPLARLRILSEQPITPLTNADIRLWISDDNREYRVYEGPMTFSQGEADFPHYQWTPAGKVPQEGTRHNWFIELDGLQIDAPYTAIEIIDKEVRCVNFNFLLVEALDTEGHALPYTLSSKCAPGWASCSEGYYFGKGWPSWMNYTEKVIDRYTWAHGPLAIAWRVMDHMPTMLEPSFAGARQIWLDSIERILQTGVDGVDLRILCHHNASVSWLTYAFAEPVLTTFQERYGREVEPTAEDYEQVRRIRGEYFTQFLREAKALTQRGGKKLSIHFEPGIEVEPQYDTRIQIHLNWRQWIEEGLMDEITAKFWNPHSPFIQQQVLPLARRHGIPVLNCDRNGALNVPRGIELGERMVRESFQAGLGGFTLYENANYVRLNPEGIPEPVAHADTMFAQMNAMRLSLLGETDEVVKVK